MMSNNTLNNEWQTCNKVLKKKGELGNHIFHPEMQKKELDKLNFTKLWMDGFPGIDPFHYPVWDTLPEEEEDSCKLY